MKLISLNIWGGHLKQELIAFFAAHQNIDVFCLQEVYCQAESMITREERSVDLDIFHTITDCLPQHRGYFLPIVNGVYGLAIFIKRSLKVSNTGSELIYKNADYPGYGPAHDRYVQWLEFEYQQRIMTVINMHGLWNGQGKLDAPERLLQAQLTKNFLNNLSTDYILAGDFNLRPDTESFAIIKQNLTDLIEQYGITSTRTHYYPKSEGYADYILVSENIVIKKFRVLSDVVSDHSPLFAELLS